MIHLSVIGPVTLTDHEGKRIALNGMRPKAILAALASAPEFTRSRAFLTDLLWSEKPEKQGSDSLRQMLRVIRRKLNEPLVFDSEEGLVRLNTAVIDCHPKRELQEKLAAGFESPEFADGLDVADPVFEDWIRDERARYHSLLEETDALTRKPAGLAGPITFHVSKDDARGASDYSDIFLDLYFQGISDIARLRVQEGSTSDDRDFKLRAETIGQGTLQRLRSELYESSGDRNRWAASEVLSQTSDVWDPALLRLAFRCHETSLQMVADNTSQSPETFARTRAATAFTRLLELSSEAFSATDRDFAVAYDADPRGVYLAYRAFLRTNLIVERRAADPQGLAEEARAFIIKALRDEPLNGAVNAAASHVSLLLDNDTISAREFAARSTDINAANPLAWSSLANAFVRENRPEEALTVSKRALQIARLSKFAYWWEMNASLVSAANHDPRAALEHALAARAKSPEFKPPLRYLVALHFHFGNIDAAAEALQELIRFEPDFDFRLFSDASYPTATLRQLPLREISKISSL